MVITSSVPSYATSSHLINSQSVGGVCLMSNMWKDEQHPAFIKFMSNFLNVNSFRLSVVPIAPVIPSSYGSVIGKTIRYLTSSDFLQDFIFNCGGLSVAFIFVTSWDSNNLPLIYNRVQKLKMQFARLYVVITLPTRDQMATFCYSYFKYEMVLGKPTFVAVQDLEMGFEKIVKIALSCGVCKQQDATEKLRAQRKQVVQGMDIFLRVVTSIPGIDNHDANSLNQTIGSLEAIAKASMESILENTDLSSDKADTIWRFFNEPKFYHRPKIN